MERISVQEAGLEGLPRIRGHHLNKLKELYVFMNTKRESLSESGYQGSLSGEMEALIKFFIQEHSSDLLTFVDPATRTFGLSQEWMMSYINDTIGGIEAEKVKIYNQKTYEAIVKYISYPASQQVLLTVTPDFICRLCLVGTHCLKSSKLMPLDYREIREFSKFQINRRRDMQIYTEEFKFSDRLKPLITKVVLTTFGDIRFYLSFGGIPPPG
ncbi:hypothetical protein HYW46_04110 [Candidatus Daviesbacteria bacterium]|nr:hypothetical protein [Candidatus Daviesbacteria bacterium]